MTLRTYIEQQAAGLPIINGEFAPDPGGDAITVTTPSLVKDVITSGSKYGLKRDYAGDLYVLDFSFTDLVPRSSGPQYGSGIIIKFTGDTFMVGANVDLGVGRGVWIGYGDTNWDGYTVNGEGLFALEDSSVNNFADGGIDSKATNTQINRFVSRWSGHRSLRFWNPGPHVITNSIIDNDIGSIIWCKYKATKIYVFNSLFNGRSIIPSDKIETTDDGGKPEIIYLATAAEAEALMHVGFGDIGTARPGDVEPVEPPIEPPVDPDLTAQIIENTAAIVMLTSRLEDVESKIDRLMSTKRKNR